MDIVLWSVEFVIRFLKTKAPGGVTAGRIASLALCFTWRQAAANHHGLELCLEVGAGRGKSQGHGPRFTVAERRVQTFRLNAIALAACG